MQIITLISDLIQSERMRKIFLVTTIVLYIVMGSYLKITHGFFLYDIEFISFSQLIIDYVILGLIRGISFAVLMSFMIYCVICMLSYYLAPFQILVDFIRKKINE